MNSEHDKQSGNEPGENLNVREVHAQLLREKEEPTEMMRAAPWWLKHAIIAPLLIWGLWYLLTHSGGFRWKEYSEGFHRTMVPAEDKVSSGAQNDTAPGTTSGADGEAIYQKVCATCHQATGQGVPGAFPPLAGSDWVTSDPRRPILFVLHGLQGPVEVKGTSWNSVMPPQGANLSDDEIAAVVTFVRSAWGNDAGTVSSDDVAALRKRFSDRQPWTIDELEAALE